MELKANTRFKDKAIAMAIANQIVNECYRDLAAGPCVITSANDSDHGTNSYHYSDRAFDYRVHTVPPAKLDALFAEIKRRLPLDFDIVLESRGTSNQHIHLEWDPR